MALSDTTGKRCTYTYKSTKAPHSHRSHAYNAHLDGQSKGLICHDHSTVFQNVHDFRVHLVMFHSAPSNIIALESPLGEINPEALVFWCMFVKCGFLEQSLPRTSTFLAISTASILPSRVTDSLAYTMRTGGSTRHFADEHAGLSSQFRQFANQRFFLQHVEGHLKAMDAEEHMVCPAASATANGISAQCAEIKALERESLAKHVVDAHGLLIDASKFVKENNSSGERVKKQQKRSDLGDGACQLNLDDSGRP